MHDHKATYVDAKKRFLLNKLESIPKYVYSAHQYTRAKEVAVCFVQEVNSEIVNKLKCKELVITFDEPIDNELARLRRADVLHWLARMFQSGMLTRQQYAEKMQLAQGQTFLGAAETRAFMLSIGMKDPMLLQSEQHPESSAKMH